MARPRHDSSKHVVIIEHLIRPVQSATTNAPRKPQPMQPRPQGRGCIGRGAGETPPRAPRGRPGAQEGPTGAAVGSTCWRTVGMCFPPKPRAQTGAPWACRKACPRSAGGASREPRRTEATQSGPQGPEQAQDQPRAGPPHPKKQKRRTTC